jgi:hypothetical protein
MMSIATLEEGAALEYQAVDSILGIHPKEEDHNSDVGEALHRVQLPNSGCSSLGKVSRICSITTVMFLRSRQQASGASGLAQFLTASQDG